MPKSYILYYYLAEKEEIYSVAYNLSSLIQYPINLHAHFLLFFFLFNLSIDAWYYVIWVYLEETENKQGSWLKEVSSYDSRLSLAHLVASCQTSKSWNLFFFSCR